MKKKKYLYIICFLLLIAILISVFLIREWIKIKPDFERLENESYDTVFMSMYPIDNYKEEDYTFYRGMDIVKCTYQIPNSKVLLFYMDKINKSDNAVTTVYLGIDPELTNNKDIIKIIEANPSIAYEIVLPHPQISYWTGMEQSKCEQVLDSYQSFAEDICNLPNARIYFFSGEEWLICNPLNYESENITSISISLFLMCSSDYQHSYLLKKENIENAISDMRQLITLYRDNPINYPDGSNYDIVFLGDSIFGNETNSMSIPLVVNSLTDSTVYNCAIGSKSATTISRDPLSANMILDSLITGDLSCLPQEHHLYTNAHNFVNRDKKENLMFVINYGLNDYFYGCNLTGENKFDENTFEGAIRSIVTKIQKEYPNATIILCTPNFTIGYDYGNGIQGENAGTLKDYADIIIKVAEETNVEVLDNYNELQITEENWHHLLDDGCHFNERGRFLVGSRIALLIP